MKAILLDIEGTTTPIDFVHQTLFAFARQRVEQFIKTNSDSVKDDIERLVVEHRNDRDYSKAVDATNSDSVAGYLKHLIDNDVKSTTLKSIQGKIWQEGYESGEIVSPVYDDVPRAFERWHADRIAVAIFSSGSVLAQRLLFRYTDHGDLTRFISAYFDTTTGPKRTPESYRAIADELKIDPDEVLFVSDVIEELDAARSSRMMTALAVRPGNPSIDDDVSHRIITTLDELD